MRNPANGFRRGITLVETLLLVAVIAAAATVGLFAIPNRLGQERSINSDVSVIAETLRNASSQAIVGRSMIRVTPEQADGRWRLRWEEADGPVRPARVLTIDLSPESRLRNTQSVELLPDGSANRAIRWMVRSSRANAAGMVGEVTLNPVMAQVTTVPATEP